MVFKGFRKHEVSCFTIFPKVIFDPEKFLKKVLANNKDICHHALMFESTTKYKIIHSNKLPHQFEGELKKILDKLMSPEYVRAVEKLAEICSKQNYLYN
jgi:hypothetical protein